MRIFVSILLFGLFIAGCSANSVDDAGITARIKTKLAANDNTSSLQIDVDTKNGYVTLSGVVPTDTEKNTAEELAQNTEGVKAVTNVMRVDPNVIGATNIEQKAQAAIEKINQTGVAIEDAGILTEIKAQFVANGILGTDVDVNKGDVTLTGELESAQKKSEAFAIVKRTKGVRSIKNQLTVKKS